MRGARALLGRPGDAGLYLPALAILPGLALPGLAESGQAVLLPCVVLFMAMSIGLAEPGEFRCA